MRATLRESINKTSATGRLIEITERSVGSEEEFIHCTDSLALGRSWQMEKGSDNVVDLGPLGVSKTTQGFYELLSYLPALSPS